MTCAFSSYGATRSGVGMPSSYRRLFSQTRSVVDFVARARALSSLRSSLFTSFLSCFVSSFLGSPVAWFLGSLSPAADLCLATRSLGNFAEDAGVL